MIDTANESQCRAQPAMALDKGLREGLMMIAQLSNREYLLLMAESVHIGLDRAVTGRAAQRRRGRPTDLDALTDGELREVAGAFASITEAPEGLPLEHPGEPTADDVQHSVRPKEDMVFVPRDPLLSLLQSVLEEHYETREADAIRDRPLLDDRRGGAEPVWSDRQLKDIRLGRAAGNRRLWGRMEVAHPKLLSDPAWVLSAVAMAYRAARGRAAFVDDPPVVRIGNEARVLVVGDWGSGIPRAKKVADQMRIELATNRDREQHVIHLGDVYYSGFEREYENHFLRHWPVAPGSHVGSYSLNGNHDMYSGGRAYYGTCLADARFARQNGCSYFALRNDHWQLLALDSSYEDGGLHGGQGEWARNAIADAPGLKTALLSHHQPFSAHEKGAATLLKKIRPVLATDRVDAWFWGHEHRCIQYNGTRLDGLRVGFSTCVGHGGIPEYLVMHEGETRPAPWAYEYVDQYGDGWEPWDTFGFAVLEFTGDRMGVRYVNEDGVVHHQVPDVSAVPA
jgi:hypothetical protein